MEGVAHLERAIISAGIYIQIVLTL